MSGEYFFFFQGSGGVAPPPVLAIDAGDIRNYIITMTPFSLEPILDYDDTLGGAPIGVLPIAGAPGASLSAQSELGFSSIGYTSASTDTPASTYYEARVTNAGTFERTLVGAPRFSGGTSISGEVELANGDGGMDDVVGTNTFDGRPIRIRYGKMSQTLVEYLDIFTGTMGVVEARLQDIFVSLSDGANIFDKDIQTNVYAGTGGNEGGADIKGRHKPLCFGHVKNITPILVDPVLLIYQVHDGLMFDVPAVYDRGVSLTKVTGTPVAGQYSVDTAAGTFRLGATPAGTVTCDVKGHATLGYIDSAGAIIRRIIEVYGGLVLSEINQNSFLSPGAAFGYEFGIYIDQEGTSINQVLSACADSASGFYGFSRLGQFEVGQVREPTGFSFFSIDSSIIYSIERVPLPADVNPAVWRVSIGYGRNHTVQTDLAASVTAARRSFTASEYRRAVAEDLAVKSRHKLAKEITIDTGFVNESDALAEAQRLLFLYREPRALYRILTIPDAITIGLGNRVDLTIARYGLNISKPATIVAQRFDANNARCEFTVMV